MSVELYATLGLPQGAVPPAEAAARAGLRSADLIIAIDGQAVDDPNAFDYRFATRPLAATLCTINAATIFVSAFLLFLVQPMAAPDAKFFDHPSTSCPSSGGSTRQR